MQKAGGNIFVQSQRRHHPIGIGLVLGEDAVPTRIESLHRHVAREAHRLDSRNGCQLIENLVLCSRDRKSTRLNSSHITISYAVFCLKKKKKNITFTFLPI